MKQMLFTAFLFGMILIGCGQSPISQTEQEPVEQQTAAVDTPTTELVVTPTSSIQLSEEVPPEATVSTPTEEVIEDPQGNETAQQATMELPETSITQVVPTETPVESLPEPEPATPEGSDGGPTATPFVGDPVERLQTAVPASDPNPTQVETIPIYGIGEAAGGQGEEAYARDVTEATSADLATRLGVSVDTVVVVNGSYGEVQSMAPCGTSSKDSGQPIGDGMEFGYEVVYEVSGATFRYIGVGGLAYYCGAE
ncbi:MAG: hypothetical protein AAGF95_15875 [Chloroflexota bacterium]